MNGCSIAPPPRIADLRDEKNMRNAKKFQLLRMAPSLQNVGSVTNSHDFSYTEFRLNIRHGRLHAV
jgi:hypothetical protein